MLIRKFLLIVVAVSALVSCSKTDEETKELSSYVSSYLKDNREAVFFGHINIDQILNKADYKQHELLQAVIDFNLGTLENSIDVKTPVYFIGEGPLKQDGSPERLHFFIKVKNEDSLIGRLSDTWSYDVNLADDFSFTEDGDFALGIKKNLAIVTITGNEYDAEALMRNNFKKASGDAIGGKDEEILKEQGDFVVGVKLENLYGTSNTDLAKLEQSIQDEIKEMAKDSYISTSLLFEEGSMKVESKNLFSQKLKDELFFRSDASSDIYNKLNKGDGTMLAGFAANIDPDKLEAFSKKYSPEVLDEINEIFGLRSMGLIDLLGSERILSKLGDGQFGISVYGEPEMSIFNVNAFFGATDTGKRLFMASSGSLPSGVNYEYGDGGVYLRGGFLNPSEESSSNRIKIPQGCEVFGKKGVTAFVNFRDVDVELFEFSGEMKLIEIVEYATFEYNENGGVLFVKAKNGQENVLKQSLDILIEQLSSMLNGVSV